MMMKCRKTGIILLLCGAMLSPQTGFGQAQEAAQLLLNVKKLDQLKKILQTMYTGYKILDKGYNAVKDIAKGDFSLHEAFLDGLLAVNPKVRKYHRVADIIRYQQYILAEYKSAWNRCKSNGHFSPEELIYLAEVYHNLFDQSLRNLDEMTLILTAGKLRMSDDERIQAIDRVFDEMEGLLRFLRSFNHRVETLGKQRQLATDQLELLQKQYGNH